MGKDRVINCVALGTGECSIYLKACRGVSEECWLRMMCMQPCICSMWKQNNCGDRPQNCESEKCSPTTFQKLSSLLDNRTGAQDGLSQTRVLGQNREAAEDVAVMDHALRGKC